MIKSKQVRCQKSAECHLNLSKFYGYIKINVDLGQLIQRFSMTTLPMNESAICELNKFQNLSSSPMHVFMKFVYILK